MNITKESWDAMVAGQLRDRDHIIELEWRLLKLAKQVESLSWKLEYLADATSIEGFGDIVLDECAREWGKYRRNTL